MRILHLLYQGTGNLGGSHACGLVGLVSSCLAVASLGVSPMLVWPDMGRVEGRPWLLWMAHLDAVAPALALSAAAWGLCSWHSSTRSPLEGRCRVAPLPGATLRRALGPGLEYALQDPGAALLLNIDGLCLCGGLGALTLQIIFAAAVLAQVPPCLQHSSQVGRGAPQAGGHFTAWPLLGAAPGLLLCQCMVVSEVDPGEGKEESAGTLEWGCEVGRGADLVQRSK